MGYDEVFAPFAVAAITPLGCAWVASRFVPPTNKWIYGSVVIGTAYLSWKYIVPRMLTSMGYPVPFEAESDYEESYDDLLDEMGESAISNYSVSWLLQQADPIAYEVGLNDYESFMLSEHEDDASMYSEWFDKDGDLTRKGEQEIPAIYDESLDEMGTEWLANKYNASWLLKRGDPIAYGVGLSDYESSMEEDFEAETSDYEKLEYIHSTLQECSGDDIMVETSLEFVEDLREPYFDENGDLKNAESFSAEDSGEILTFGRIVWSASCDDEDFQPWEYETEIKSFIRDKNTADGEGSFIIEKDTWDYDENKMTSYNVFVEWTHHYSDFNTAESFSAEGDSGEVYALKKALKAYKGTLEDCLDGRYGTDDAESVMDDLEDSHHIVRFLGAESFSAQEPSNENFSANAGFLASRMCECGEYGDCWLRGPDCLTVKAHEDGTCGGVHPDFEGAGCPMCEWDEDNPLEKNSFSAESKFVKPYDRRGKIDFRRDNKGRYRRKLSIPLKKR